MLSTSVSKALELVVGDDAEETSIFTLNVSSFDEGKRSRNPFKSPYRSRDDFRLKVSKKEILIFLLTYNYSG